MRDLLSFEKKENAFLSSVPLSTFSPPFPVFFPGASFPHGTKSPKKRGGRIARMKTAPPHLERHYTPRCIVVQSLPFSHFPRKVGRQALRHKCESEIELGLYSFCRSPLLFKESEGRRQAYKYYGIWFNPILQFYFYGTFREHLSLTQFLFQMCMKRGLPFIVLDCLDY